MVRITTFRTQTPTSKVSGFAPRVFVGSENNKNIAEQASINEDGYFIMSLRGGGVYELKVLPFRAPMSVGDVEVRK